MRIQSDEPVSTDSLDRDKFASALARVVETCDTPLVIGLYGTWGIGKTSLMKQIERILHESLHVRTVWFDPWQHQFDEDPAVALLHTMVSQLGLGEEGKKILTVIATALGSVLLKVTTTLNSDDIQRLGDKYEEERFQVREKQVRLREYFGALISQASERGKHRLVFFIDDLDRCVPEQVLKVLEALKLYLSIPNCVFVIGVDRAALECSIRHRYKEQEVREADYLDKIVQLPFTIPPIANESMTRFVGTLLDDSLAAVADLLVAGLGDNPRQVKRFVNTLLLNHELATASFGNYDQRILTAVLVIQYRRPDLFRAAATNPEVLVALAKKGDAAKPYEDFVKADPRLQDVIGKAGFTSPERIPPYIFLSEIAGVRPADYRVVMTKLGTYKINVIKVIREHTKLGLKDAKDLAETEVPVTVGTALSRELAEAFAESLRSVGATASVE
jgi:hypothetical protein